MPLQQTSNNPFMLGDTERGDYSYAGLSPDEALVQRQIAQRRQMAKALMSRGMEQAGKRGGMVGPWYVKSSPMEGLSGMAQVGLGALGDAYFAKQSADAAEEHKKLREEAINRYISQTTDIPAVKANIPPPAIELPSNLEGIIGESQQKIQLTPQAEREPLRPMNRDAIKFALLDNRGMKPRFSENELARFASGNEDNESYMRTIGEMANAQDPRFTEYVPPLSIPEMQGPATPGSPARKRTDAEIMQANFEAFKLGDPRLNAIVQHTSDARDKKEQYEQARLDRESRDRESRAFKELMLAAQGTQAKDLKGMLSADEKARQEGAKSRTRLGELQAALDTLTAIDPNSEPAKVLRAFIEKETTHRPPDSTTVNVPVSTEKKYSEHLAQKTAESDIGLRESAMKAPDLADRANRIADILRSGEAFTGTGAEWKLHFSKLASAAGLISGDSASATEALVQELAGNTLDSIKSAGLGTGQGFTNKDLDFLEKAKSGKISLERQTLERLNDLIFAAATQSRKQWDARKRTISPSALEGTGLNREELPKMPARHSYRNTQSGGVLPYVPASPVNAQAETETERAIVSTGKEKGTGRAVIKYSDGTIEYAN